MKDQISSKGLIGITIPIFFELLLVTIVGNVDIIMLGKYSEEAVSAVGGITQSLIIQNVIFSFISLGTTILITQYLGAKRHWEIKKIISVSLVLNLFIALLLGSFYVFGSNFILKGIKLSDNLIAVGRNYFMLVGGFCIFQGLTLTCSAVMKGHGRTKEVFYINLGINLLNVIGNSLFIFGWLGAPKLGVTGVGISTVGSRMIGCVVAFIVMKKITNYSFDFGIFKRFPLDILKKLGSIGIPTAGENLCYNVAQLIILSFVNKLGDDVIAARTYLTLIASIIMTFSISIGHGTAIQIGHLIGQGEKEIVYKKCLRSTLLAFILASTITLIVIFNGRWILSFFKQSSSSLDIALNVFKWFIFVESGRVFNIVIINSLHASGDITYPAILAIIFMFGAAVPLAYLFGVHLKYGLVGIWIANGIDEWCRGIAMLIRWKSKKWMGKAFV